MIGLTTMLLVIFINWILFSNSFRKLISKIHSNSRKEKITPIEFPNTTKPKEFKPFVESHIGSIERPKEISVSPKTINTNPKPRLSLVDGEYRTFQNHIIDGVQYTFGFPKHNCNDKSVWVGKDQKQSERISLDEAIRRIQNNEIGPNVKSKQIDSSNSYPESDDLPF